MFITNLFFSLLRSEPIGKSFKIMMRETYPGNDKSLQRSMFSGFIAFLGLPNRQLDDRARLQPGWNLVRNFIGWQKDTSIIRLFFYFLLITPINIIITPLKFFHNVLKLFSEVLPALLTTACAYLFASGLEFVMQGITDLSSSKRNKLIIALSGALYVLAGIGVLLSLGAIVIGVFSYFAGRCLTSPIEHLQDMYHASFKHGKLLAFLAVAVTLLIIVLVYAIFFPLALKGISTSILPFLATHLPSAMLAFVNTIFDAIYPILSAVGNFIIPFANFFFPVIHLLGITTIMAAQPAIVGLGAFAGLGIGTVGVAISDFVNYISKKWHTPKNKVTVADIDKNLSDKASRTNPYVVNSRNINDDKFLPYSNNHGQVSRPLFAKNPSPKPLPLNKEQQMTALVETVEEHVPKFPKKLGAMSVEFNSIQMD